MRFWLRLKISYDAMVAKRVKWEETTTKRGRTKRVRLKISYDAMVAKRIKWEEQLQKGVGPKG
jgi:hypothetical protein